MHWRSSPSSLQSLAIYSFGVKRPEPEGPTGARLCTLKGKRRSVSGGVQSADIRDSAATGRVEIITSSNCSTIDIV